MQTVMRKGHRLLRIIVFILSLVAPALTGVALLTAAGLKTDGLAGWLLTQNPRFRTAMSGLHKLEDFKYPLNYGLGGPRDVGVLKITDPSWDVMLDFVQSEIAIRKSIRNLPISPKKAGGQPANSSTSVAGRELIPKKDFYLAKTLVALRFPVASAGDQPLAPPFRLYLSVASHSPRGMVPREVYEFISFEEFRLDLRRMILNQMEEWSLWLAFIGFAATLLIGVIQKAMVLFGS